MLVCLRNKKRTESNTGHPALVGKSAKQYEHRVEISVTGSTSPGSKAKKKNRLRKCIRNFVFCLVFLCFHHKKRKNPHDLFRFNTQHIQVLRNHIAVLIALLTHCTLTQSKHCSTFLLRWNRSCACSFRWISTLICTRCRRQLAIWNQYGGYAGRRPSYLFISCEVTSAASVLLIICDQITSIITNNHGIITDSAIASASGSPRRGTPLLLFHCPRFSWFIRNSAKPWAVLSHYNLTPSLYNLTTSLWKSKITAHAPSPHMWAPARRSRWQLSLPKLREQSSLCSNCADAKQTSVCRIPDTIGY